MRQTNTLRKVKEVEVIDQILAEEGAFDGEAHAVRELRNGLLRSTLQWHMREGTPYAGYAHRCGFHFENFGGDLDEIPLLPSMLFKRAGLSIAHPAAEDVLWTTSSGTKGSISRIPRDDDTLRRFFSSIGNLSNEMLDIENSDVNVFNLGPDASEARALWISYVMAGITVLLPKSRYYFKNDKFLMEQLIKDVGEVAHKRVALIGPPAFLLEVASTILARGIDLALHRDSLIITIGGWKRRSGERVSRKTLDERLSSAFGLEQSRIRDTFNMVELNSVVIECSHKKLHIPPWLYARARDAQTLKVLPSAQEGVLSYLDATATSYPGFILSDDLGHVVENDECGCGRRSDVLHISRRLNTVESRGCALKMDIQVAKSGVSSQPGAQHA